MTLRIEDSFDIADEGQYVVDVVETGGSSFTVTISTGVYFMDSEASSATGDYSAQVTGIDSFTLALQDALEAGSDPGDAFPTAYTVFFTESTGRVTVTHDGTRSVTAIQLDPISRGGLIGQTSTKSGSLSLEMDVTPEHYILGEVGFWSDYHEHELDEDIGFISRMSDGTPYGVSKAGVATLLDLTVPLEPRAAVYTSHLDSDTPWTWQKLFRSARNVQPIRIADGTLTHYVKLRRPAFNPLRRAADYVGHYDIRIQSDLLARDP